MNRTILTTTFVALVVVPVTGIYLIRSGFYPAAVANGTLISGRAFERQVEIDSRELPDPKFASALRQTVLDRMVEAAIVADIASAQGQRYGAYAGLMVAARRQARVYIFAAGLTWDGEKVVPK